MFARLTFNWPQLYVRNSDVTIVWENEGSINILGIKVAEDSNWVWIKGQQGMSCINIAHVHAIDLELRLVEFKHRFVSIEILNS